MPSTPHFWCGLRLNALDGVKHFQAKVVAAGGEIADRAADQVVSDDGGDSCGQSCGSSYESLGYARGNRAQRGAAGRAQAVKGVNDAPHRAEQSNERSDGCSNGEPWNVALEARDFFRGSDLHA